MSMSLDGFVAGPSQSVPILLERGERLFDGLADLHDLKLARTVAMPQVVHLKFARGEGIPPSESAAGGP